MLSKLSLNAEGGEGSRMLEGRDIELLVLKLVGLEPECWLEGREGESEKVLDERLNSLLPLPSRELARGDVGLEGAESSSITFVRPATQLYTERTWSDFTHLLMYIIPNGLILL